ncbi:MAG: bifunctional diaminohydroxyphosphoribosylaminopyrimidine deaminase/5-amino-6-(5-phosphoribosylamino)uracil reductase RibD [Candidatus Cloacimonadales bacterium]|nr:bifunctional diaminohydroxyphosphoribosylaminopyrimidine deaminase/5-amino-6-(5-phosphoribosylamino)uracil reductase RibD [Candidatus Cloacimonadales bacterium]
MKLALELAEEFKGKTNPNPLVGAVVVKNGEIVGKGAHQFAGGPHAEVYALEEAGEKANGATLYVTLEPCCHFGKTPPCTDRIIKAGIAKVVIATLDPNPLVAGKGIKQLQAAGIEVEIGMSEQEAKQQNEIFFYYIQTRKPFVIAKAAISLDGKIATASGDSKWISNAESRRKVHELRSQIDAVLIGKNTLLKDNPRLNVRLEKESEGPQKIVLLPNLELRLERNVELKRKSNLNVEPKQVAEQLSQMNVYKTSISKHLIIVCHESAASKQRIEEFQKYNIEIIPISGKTNGLNLEELLKKLGEREITNLLLEGGSGVYTSFLKAGLINKFHIFQAPIFIGNDGIPILQNLEVESMKYAFRMQDVKIEKLGDNVHWECNTVASTVPERSR